MKAWHAGCALVLALLLAGCPRNDADTTTASSAPTATAPAADAPTSEEPAAAPVADDSTPPPAASAPQGIAVGEPNPGAPSVVDASCKTDADCTIKDVGSCCGYRPACVNTASPTFPDKVKAECASSGRVSTCGFPAITGCTCNAGKCEGTGSDLGEKVQ
jgi:hypothetical protein